VSNKMLTMGEYKSKFNDILEIQIMYCVRYTWLRRSEMVPDTPRKRYLRCRILRPAKTH